jgi:hypothetical protein
LGATNLGAGVATGAGGIGLGGIAGLGATGGGIIGAGFTATGFIGAGLMSTGATGAAGKAAGFFTVALGLCSGGFSFFTALTGLGLAALATIFFGLTMLFFFTAGFSFFTLAFIS